MATSVLSPLSNSEAPYSEHSGHPQRDYAFAACLVTGLTVCALVVLGYHPFAEDGGLYLGGSKRVVESRALSEWLRVRAGSSALFAVCASDGCAGALVGHAAGDGAAADLSGEHMATLAAGWMLASRCFVSEVNGSAQSALLAVWLHAADRGNITDADGPLCDGAKHLDPMRAAGSGGWTGFSASPCSEGQRWHWGRLRRRVRCWWWQQRFIR